MDHLTKDQRSDNMARIKGLNTKPELIVRSLLHRQGFRFRINKKALPGKPDIVLPKYKTVIFVHGCFWHQHSGCKRSNIPKSNTEYWVAKLNRNKTRDVKNECLLKQLGWKVIVIWECETKNESVLLQKYINKIKKLS